MAPPERPVSEIGGMVNITVEEEVYGDGMNWGNFWKPGGPLEIHGAGLEKRL